MAGLSLVACGGGDEENFLSPILQKFKHRVHGTVSSYDASAKTFTVTDKKGRPFAFSMDERTKMEGTIADGAMATVRYRQHGAARTATIVKIFPTATSAAPATPATTTAAPAMTTATTGTGEKKQP
ncbi:MAG TPA: hypothetical protein VG777_09695 [Thermoanaerobaculia bacterium]|nr:hypothetical protein [Thermoanaerobaculia bacterium]